MTTGFKIEFPVKQAHIQIFGDALDPYAFAIAAYETVPGGDWRIEAYTDIPPDPDQIAVALRDAALANDLAVPAFRVGPLPAVDWLAENRRNFPTQDIGRFFIYGSHHDGRVPAGRRGMLLDAATAFGSGEHATTRGCLMVIDRLGRGKRRFRQPLDVGCGSGILAIGMAKVWPVRVMAGDIDPESVRVARENGVLNRVGARIRAVRATGYAHREIAARRPYDLITANILARPLCKLARDLAYHLAPGGVAILSGLLTTQETQVLAAHRLQGLVLTGRVRRDGWSTLILRRGRR